MKGKTNIEDALTYDEIASDRSKLPYDPANPASDGSVLIGITMSIDGSCDRWSVVPEGSGYAMLIEGLSKGFDENGEPILLDKPQRAFFLPVEDISEEKKHGIELGVEKYKDLPDYVPSVYASVEDAYAAFLEVVYSSEHTEELYNIECEANAIINGYIDPKTEDFEKFRQAFWNVCSWDEYAEKLSPTRLANAMLCVRYPFLIPWGYGDAPTWDDEESFEYTRFTSIPKGWAKRFGLELCEDLRNQAYDKLEKAWTWRLCNMGPDQIKEKFGGLRWYGVTYGRGHDLLDAYENISYEVCIECGKADSTRITSGWICPVCLKDAIPGGKSSVEDQSFKKYLADPDNASWKERAAASTLGKYVAAVSTTRHGATSTQMLSLLTSWTVQSYSNEGMKERNLSKGLLDGSKAPNGQPIWAREVIIDVAADIARLESDPIGDDVREAISMLGVDESEIPDWWSDDKEW